MPDEMIVEVPVDAVVATPDGGQQVETEANGAGEKAKRETDPKTGRFVAKEAKGDGVDELRAQLEAKTASEAALRQKADERDAEARKQTKAAQDATAELERTKVSARSSDISAIDASIRAAQTEADQAQAQQQTAFENGDFKAASDAGRKMAAAESRLQRLQEGKSDLELQARELAAKSKAEPATVDAQGDPAKPHPKAQAWLSAHPEYLTDQRKQAKATSAHWGAVSEGLDPSQDEYYDFVEKALGLKAEPAKKEAKVEKQDKQFSAPVTREDAPSAGASSTKVTLTPGEVANATDGTLTWNRDDPTKGIKRGQPIGVVEMARRKLALTKEGRYMNNGDQ